MPNTAQSSGRGEVCEQLPEDSAFHHRSQLRRLGACPGGAFQRWWSFRPDICLRQALGGCSQRVAINTIPPDLGRCPSSPPQFRSEEHTSELQSLMRISYAVFFLKKK